MSVKYFLRREKQSMAWMELGLTIIALKNSMEDKMAAGAFGRASVGGQCGALGVVNRRES